MYVGHQICVFELFALLIDDLRISTVQDLVQFPVPV